MSKPTPTLDTRTRYTRLPDHIDRAVRDYMQIHAVSMSRAIALLVEKALNQN